MSSPTVAVSWLSFILTLGLVALHLTQGNQTQTTNEQCYCITGKRFPFFLYKTHQDKIFFLKSYACNSHQLLGRRWPWSEDDIDFYFNLFLQEVWTVALSLCSAHWLLSLLSRLDCWVCLPGAVDFKVVLASVATERRTRRRVVLGSSWGDR
jgi:hypothetical protein